MKESQQKIKTRVEGVSGSNSVKIILDGEEKCKNELSVDIMKEDKIL